MKNGRNSSLICSFMLSMAFLSVGTLSAQSGFVPGKAIPVIELDNLVQGRLHVAEYPGVKGSPYLSLEYLPGNIRYLDQEYRGLPLRYDIASDELVFLQRSEKGIRKVQLTKEFIRYFTLGDRYFINLNYSQYRNAGLKSGYYEVIVEDEITILAKRHVITEIRESQAYFKTQNAWFLIRDGQAYSIHTRKSLLAAFGSQYRKSITGFLRKELISPRKADDVQWLRLATYLNTLFQAT